MPDNAEAEAKITPRYMLLLIVSIPVFAWIYYLVGTKYFDSPLSLEEYVVFSTLVAIIVTGCYQLFFWVQRNNYYFKTRCFVSPWDSCRSGGSRGADGLPVGEGGHPPFWTLPRSARFRSFLGSAGG